MLRPAQAHRGLLSNVLKAPQWQTRSSWRCFQWKLATLCQWRRPKCISMPKGRETALGRCAQRPPGAFCALANARCMRVLVRVSCVRACRCVNKAHGGRATGTRDRPGAQREPEWGGCHRRPHRVRLGVALALWVPSLGGVTVASRTRRIGPASGMSRVGN